MDRLDVSADSGTLTLHTGVEGRAAKMGHRLTIALRRWEASADFDGDEPSSVRLHADLDSFEVVSGDGGVKPLSDKDRASIRDNALETMKAAQHPHVTFESQRIERTADGYALSGDLSIAGVARPQTVSVSVEDGDATWQVRAVAQVRQSDHGIKPYSAMMGGLKVSDQVEVRLNASVPKD